MQKPKILITGSDSMLAFDFIKTQSEKYDIIAVSKKECDIISFASILQCISLYEPDILLNSAAYTHVDDAEDIGMLQCYEVNTLGVKNLAKATAIFGVKFITLSTDYVFDGLQKDGYLPSHPCNPLNNYGMSKYLWEGLAKEENPDTIIVRTSWLYGGEVHDGNLEKKWVYKNFVNTMLRLSETQTELRVVSDQFGVPTSCTDLSSALSFLIDEIDDYLWQTFHFANDVSDDEVSWADFAREIFRISGKNIKVIDCTSGEYLTKAKRPVWSVLKNDSSIHLWDWKSGLQRYLK